MQCEKVFLRHSPPKVLVKQKPCILQSSCHHFGRMNLSLAGCSSAEPASVLVQQIKSQNQTLYLQLVEKSSHVQIVVVEFTWRDKEGRLITSQKGTVKNISPNSTGVADSYFDEMPAGATYAARIDQVRF